MGFDADLAQRIRLLMAGERGLTEKQMFGGIAFLINGNMAVSASSEGGILLRVPIEQTDLLMDKPFVGPCIMRSRAMQGWLRVVPEGLETQAQLRRWVDRGVAYARTLPKK